MATQDFRISEPFVSGPTSLTFISEKEKKKKEEELLKLGAALKQVEDVLAQVKGGGKEEKIVPLYEGSPEEGPSNSAFLSAMEKMVLELQLLQVEIAKFGQKKASMDYDISKAQVDMAQINLKELDKEIKKLTHEQHKSKTDQKIEKWCEYAAIAFFVLTGQIQLALPMIAMMILSQTHAVKSVTNAMATSMMKTFHIKNKLEAEILSAIILILITVIVTGAIAYAFKNPAIAVDADADVASEEVELESMDAAQTAVQDATQDVGQEGQQFSQRVTSILKTAYSYAKTAMSSTGRALRFINLLNRLPRWVNLGLMMGLQMTNQTQLVQNSVQFHAEQAGWSQEKEDSESEKWEIVAAVLTAIVMIGACDGMSSAPAKEVDEEANQMTRMEKILRRLKSPRVNQAINKLSNFMKNWRKLAQTSDFFIAVEVGRQAALLGAAIAEIKAGKVTIEEGDLQAAIARNQGNLELIHALIEMASQQISQDQHFEAQTLYNQKTGEKSITKLMRGEAAFARVLCSPA